MKIEIRMSLEEIKSLAIARIKKLYPDHKVMQIFETQVDISPNTRTLKFSGFMFTLTPPKDI